MLWARPSQRLFRQPKRPSGVHKYFANIPAKELVYPESRTPNHHDLPSFLEYAARIGMDLTSTSFVGTQYEYTVQNSLMRLGMSLKRIGGASDCGIDLLGTWKLPSVTEPLKVLIQCKALARKVEPAVARELEGAFVGAPTGWRDTGVLGFLVSQKPATKGVREAMGRSRWPMGYVLCEPDGRILQMLWNRRAQEEGLHGVGVHLKYLGGDLNYREIVLISQENEVPPGVALSEVMVSEDSYPTPV